MFPLLTFFRTTHTKASRNHLCALFIFILSVTNYSPNAIASSAAVAQQEKPKNAEEITTLELGKPVERELAGEEEHHYQISLTGAQYARVMVETRDTDVVVRLLGEDGKSIVDFNTVWRKQGEATIELVSASPFPYRLLVKAKYPKLPAGHYDIRLAEVRAATEQDRLLDEARRLYTVSWRLRLADKYSEALTAAERVLELQERVLGREHRELAYTLYVLGVIVRFKVDYAKAEALNLRALEMAEKCLGPDHPLAGLIVHSLAYNYSQKGDYARAQQLYERAISIREKALGPDHPEVATSLSNLADLYVETGDYVRPEALLQRAVRISQNALGDENVETMRELDMLANCYRARGDFTNAEALYKRLLAFWEKSFGPEHGWVAIGLHNLADLYRDMGDYDKAAQLYERAITIDEKNNGPNHPVVIYGRADLALIYGDRGDYVRAEMLYRNVLPALETVLGPTHPWVGFHLVKLAGVYVALNDYAKAETLYQRAIPIMEAYGGENCPQLAEALVGLAQISEAERKSEQAIAFQARANAIIEHNLAINLATGSEQQKLAYLQTLPQQLNEAISLNVRFANDARARDLALTAVLQRKGRVQDALSNNLYSLRNRFNPEDQALLDQLNRTTSRLARLVLNVSSDTSAPDQQKEVKSLEQEREKIEAEISNRSAEFRSQKQPITLDSVRRAVPEDAALIEFAIYRPFDPKAPNERMAYGEPRYVAYVLRRQGDVQWKELGDAKTIDHQVELFRQALSDPQRKDVRQLARAMDETVMQPIRSLLGDARQLLVSPDGELNLVPFAAMVDERGQYLIENYSMTYLTSGRDLLRMQVVRESRNNPLVMANPLFGEPERNLLAKASAKLPERNGRRRSITTGSDLSEVYFAPLDGTAQEANSIAKLFPEAKVLAGAQATETAIKQAAAPRILHIATHGFFLSEPHVSEPGAVATGSATRPGSASQSVPPAVAGGSTRAIGASARIANPLLRSGLAFAGANLRHTSDIDDGILTALEASGLNLWGTKLVVLSACDTGVGEVRNGEGVYGLRRSFFLAGAESLVMSLWPASDYTTRELMTGYYRNLKAGLGRGEALRQVQLDMLKRNPKLHPFYWANFIQSGEWADLNGKR